MQEVIKVDQLSKSYGSLAAVDHISLSVKRGTAFGLIGANGAGKSTTIECILGTKNADKGKVAILGKDPAEDRETPFERIGVQFQESNYQDQIKVGELCEVTASLYQRAANPSVLLERFGLADKKKSLVKELSGGQRQRLFIVLALIPSPEVVFLDELSNGLDAKARREIWKILSDLKGEGLTIFLTSHFMDEVETLCDCICILKREKLFIMEPSQRQWKKSPYDKFEDAYLWYTDEEEQDYENI